MRVRRVIPVSLLLLGAACHGSQSPSPKAGRTSASRAARDAATSRDEQDRRIARLELQLFERDATIEDLQQRLDDAQAEIVRAMARLPTAASRAEAASGIAEAEVALRSLRAGGPAANDAARQVSTLLTQGSNEFDKGNFGGALYLANQARALATSAPARLTSGSRGPLRQGETAFAVPVRLRATGRGNVRTGPGTGFGVAFAVVPGASLTGVSYADEWIRVSDDSGRAGWISKALVARP